MVQKKSDQVQAVSLETSLHGFQVWHPGVLRGSKFYPRRSAFVRRPQQEQLPRPSLWTSATEVERLSLSRTIQYLQENARKVGYEMAENARERVGKILRTQRSQFEKKLSAMKHKVYRERLLWQHWWQSRLEEKWREDQGRRWRSWKAKSSGYHSRNSRSELAVLKRRRLRRAV